jgi:hypothetical protein
MHGWRTEFSAGSASVVAAVSEPSGRAGLRGWVIVGRGMTPARRPVLESILAELHDSGLGTIVLPIGGLDLPTMAGWVAIAAGHLRHEQGEERPIAYLGARRAAAGGWLAAVGGDLDGVMAWNARPGRAWAYLPAVSAPSLLVVDRKAWRPMVTARAAGWRLGGHAELTRATSVADVGVLTDWFERRLLTPPAPVRTRHVLVPSGRTRVASLMVGAAIAAGPLTATTAAFALPDFSAGTRLAADRLAGDSARTSPSIGTRPTGTDGGTWIVKPGDIKGDGPIGDPPLTDGIGLRWNVNTNVGFATTSSASGAASEAGFTHAVAASTLNGGSVNQVLADTFDGYNALCLDVNNVGGQCNTLNMSVYNQNGPATLECSGRQVVLPLRTMGNLQVRRKVFVPTNDGFARWLNIIRNTSATTQTVRLQTSNNLGSDANTRIVTTSDGDATPELTDTWVTTFQNYSGTTSSDARVGHVMRGPNGVVGLSALSFVNGDDNPFWRYVFTLAPGQTAIIMNFATGQATKAAAATKAASLADLTNPNALACMTAAEIGQVLNFKTDSVLPTCSYSIINANPKRIDFTVQDAGSGISSIQIPTANNILPVNIPAFTVGTTTQILFSAVKDNQAASSQVAVIITDVQGNRVSCI